MVLVVDPQVAGISGDMLLCALADLGADKKAVVDGVLDSVRFLDGASINSMSFEPVVRNGTSALALNLDVCDVSGDSARHSASRMGVDMASAIGRASSTLGLSDAASSYASRCISILLQSESKVHGVGPDSVTLHEASHADTLVDIIGTAIALDDLGMFDHRMVCLPICVGGGSVKFSHGIASNPAGAILEILKNNNLMMRGSPAGCELATPTGACMLAALCPDNTEFYPYMGVESVGYGAGTLDHANFANVLKLVLGPEPSSACGGSDSASSGYDMERICMLETNVDDVSGEVLGGLVKRIMDAGAKDVTICPAITKKNRPANMISVMCDMTRSGIFVNMLMSETGTLGVRIHDSARVVAQRREHAVPVNVNGVTFDVRYKRSAAGGNNHNDNNAGSVGNHGPAGTICNDHTIRGNADFGRLKIEFDDICSVSDALGISIRDAESALYAKVQKIITDGITTPKNTAGSTPCDTYDENNHTCDGGTTAHGSHKRDGQKEK